MLADVGHGHARHTVGGILAYGSYVPFRRLDRSEIAAVAGKGGGKGARSVAAYDEDTTTMAVEAARYVLGSLGADYEAAQLPNALSLWFATTAPAYADKTNATAIHAALELDPGVPAFDMNGAVRSTIGMLRSGLASPAHSLLTAADIRGGLPGSADEASGGDAAAALLVGAPTDATPLLAETLGWGSATGEFLDRWRSPGQVHSQSWEERFGERRYADLARKAWDDGLADADLKAEQVDRLVVAGPHARAVNAFRRSAGAAVGAGSSSSAVDLDATVGFTGAAHPFLALAAALDEAEAGEVVALVVLADGADVVFFRTTDALAAHRPSRSVADHVAAGGSIGYGRYLAWRGELRVDPPRRPEPARPSASAAGRSVDWKFSFVGSESDDGTVHMPPSPLDTQSRRMADAPGTVVTFTIDRLAYSPSPPVVFAVVDFDGGGRLPVELTDVDPEDLRIGDRVAMTFRKLFTADGIHNYFWKARPLRHEGQREGR
jgi:hydroxymethylglutaryl-CoA synthase